MRAEWKGTATCSQCWPFLFWCSQGFSWFSEMQVYTAGSRNTHIQNKYIHYNQSWEKNWCASGKNLGRKVKKSLNKKSSHCLSTHRQTCLTFLLTSIYLFLTDSLLVLYIGNCFLFYYFYFYFHFHFYTIFPMWFLTRSLISEEIFTLKTVWDNMPQDTDVLH